MTEKAAFLKKFNEAFANNDVAYLVDQVSEDIVWTMVGEDRVKGKKAFAEALEGIKSELPLTLAIQTIIIQGNDAMANGTMTSKDDLGHEQVYAFCDVYKFSGSQNGKIKEMTSYAILL